MILKKISVLNYKNIAQAELAFSPKMNCFIGHNGEGKTNLLDAVYFLSFCKSATHSVDSQNIRHGEDFFMLQGEYEHESGEPEEVYCGLKRKQKKRFKRNKKEYKRLSEHIGLVPVVLVSPADADLISGGSEERRRFMDMVIVQYDHEYLDALVRYNRALQQRNVLLKQEEEPDEAPYRAMGRNDGSGRGEDIREAKGLRGGIRSGLSGFLCADFPWKRTCGAALHFSWPTWGFVGSHSSRPCQGAGLWGIPCMVSIRMIWR